MFITFVEKLQPILKNEDFLPSQEGRSSLESKITKIRGLKGIFEHYLQKLGVKSVTESNATENGQALSDKTNAETQ